MENQTPLKLEVGGKYINRNGGIALIISKSKSGKTFKDQKGYIYRPNGEAKSIYPFVTEYDLIKEVN